MTHLLDTNVCIDVIRSRQLNLVQRIASYAVDALAISAITVSELQYGVAKSKNPEANRIALLEFLVPFAVISYDEAAAGSYGAIRAHPEHQGTPIGPMDILIAAHALSRGLVLVTNNEKVFRRVPGLAVENWTS